MDLVKKYGKVCGTCADWKFCRNTEGWRIRQSCSGIDGCFWNPPLIDSKERAAHSAIPAKGLNNMKNKADYSKYECPYSHLDKECGHKLQGPEGFADTYSVWCPCGFRGPVFYLEPKELKLKKIKVSPVQQPQPKIRQSIKDF